MLPNASPLFYVNRVYAIRFTVFPIAETFRERSLVVNKLFFRFLVYLQ